GIQHGEAAINVAQTSKAAVSPISNRQTVRGRTTRGLETRGTADLEIGATGAAPRRTISAEHLLVGIFVVLNFCCVQQITFAGEGHWVTTWGCGPQLTEPGNLPPAPLANSTLRQFVHTTIGGKSLRVRFSNAYGTNSVTINSAHVGLSAGAGSAGNGDINTATDKPLTFHGAPSVNILPGEAILSDPFQYNL